MSVLSSAALEHKSDQRYQSQWADIGVTCESCHGPGSVHAAWAKARRLAVLTPYNEDLTQSVARAVSEGREIVGAFGMGITDNVIQAIGLIRKARRDRMALADLVNQHALKGLFSDRELVEMVKSGESGVAQQKGSRKLRQVEAVSHPDTPPSVSTRPASASCCPRR